MQTSGAMLKFIQSFFSSHLSVRLRVVQPGDRFEGVMPCLLGCGVSGGVSGGVSVEVGGFGLVRCWYQGGHLLEDQPRRWMSCRTGRQVTRHFTPVHSPFYISLFNIMKAAPVQSLPIWLTTQARSIHWPEDCLHLPRLLLSPHRALCRRGDEGSPRSESVSRLTESPLQRILLIDYEIVLFWFGLQKVHRSLKPFIFSVLPILR